MSALGVLLCAACDVELHEMCGGGCTCLCHEHPDVRGIVILPAA